MTDTDHYLTFFQDHGNRLTLSEILSTTFCAEYRKHHSLLRDRGYTITCTRNPKEPGKNVYTLARKEPIQIEMAEVING